MKQWHRRTVLGLLAGLSALGSLRAGRPLAASAQPQPEPPPPPLIDAHCHLFNLTDLPVASFIQIVLLESRNPVPGPVLKGVVRLFTLGVPTARDEIGSGTGGRMIARPKSAARIALAADRLWQSKKPVVQQGTGNTCEPGGSPDTNWATAKAWLGTLRSTRASMARTLSRDVVRSGFTPRLLCPALVDYSNWLGQSLRSPLPDQMRMHGRLASTPSLPPVHGYMAFDPLRRALVRVGRRPLDGTWDPLAIAREALIDHGFLGVKVYPPMGFRAGGNGDADDDYPQWAERVFGGARNLSLALDVSLNELYALCVEQDAPIMAHGANSVAAGKGFGRRADPTFWLPVLRAHPRLRVMLAHFGNFHSYSAEYASDPACPQPVPYNSTWEAVIGRAVRANPDIQLYADISYFSELFDRQEEDRLLPLMQLYLADDPGGRHLIYGSDWIMLGIEKQYQRPPGYARRVAEFLSRCGLDKVQVHGVMYGNALRFLGLTPGARTLDRMHRFYSRHGLPSTRLPVIA